MTCDIACESIVSPSLFAAGDVSAKSEGETDAFAGYRCRCDHWRVVSIMKHNGGHVKSNIQLLIFLERNNKRLAKSF